tara:strand:- start:1254 stop:2936 length:1683 start_codon:yes stop_codon:yes gene_type:complete
MPLTYEVYTAAAGQTDFAVSFPYITPSHIKCSIDGAVITTFSVNTSTNILTLNTAAGGGEKIRVFRQTPGRTTGDAELLVDFQNGSVLTESELDTSQRQLLFLAQEAQETGQAALPVDAFGNYDAGSKRIVNLAASANDNDAVRKSYVDDLALFGQAASDPQAWTVLGDEFTGNTGDITYVLENPTPFSANENLFIVALEGYLQRPQLDFTITELLGVYTLTLKMGTLTIDADAIITVQNFGVARNVYEQPFIMADQTTPGLTTKAVEGATAPVFAVQNSSGTAVASVNQDGEFASSTLSISGTSVLANATVTGQLTSATITATNLNVSNDLSVTDDITVGGEVSVTGSVTATNGVVTGAGGQITATGASVNATHIASASSAKFSKINGYVQIVADDDSGLQIKASGSNEIARFNADGKFRVYNPDDPRDYIYAKPDNAGAGNLMLGVYNNNVAQGYFTGNGRCIKIGTATGNTDVLNRSELDARYVQATNAATLRSSGSSSTVQNYINNTLNQNTTYIYLIEIQSNGFSEPSKFGMGRPSTISFTTTGGYSYYGTFIPI